MPSPQILLIKELRRRTVAGVMDCKQALLKSDGDVEAAIKLLQARHIASPRPRRDAPEGVVACALNRKQGAIVELAAETEFVCRNQRFVEAAVQVARVALKSRGIVPARLLSHRRTEMAMAMIHHAPGGRVRREYPATYFGVEHSWWGVRRLRPQQSGAQCWPPRGIGSKIA